MKKVLLLFAILAWILCNVTSVGARPKKLNVYMAKGKGAVSVLGDPTYQHVFRNSIFAGDALTIDLSSGKGAFLSSFFSSDLVYLSLHANPGVWVVGNGDRVEVVDLIRAYQSAGKKAPGLVIVSGCETLHTASKVNFPAAIGIKPDTPKRAYIGFKTLVDGSASDRYFRVFLALWLRPQSGGSYRTLKAADVDATAYIEHVIALGGGGSSEGVTAQFFPPDRKIGAEFTIVGDSSMTVTDL